MKKLLAILIALVTTVSVAQEVKRPPITGIAYIRVYANDMDASRKFYNHELTLPETKCAKKDCMRFQVGKQQFVEVLKVVPGIPDGMQLEAFRTTDVEGLRKYLESKGVKTSAVTKVEDGKEIEVTDPEGHKIAFLQFSGASDEQGAISHRMIHIGFIVKSQEALDPFYKGILGFRPYWHGGMKEDRTDWVSMQVPDGSDWMEYMLNIPADASHRLIGVENHFSLGVVNMVDTETALEKTGWKSSKDEHNQLGRDGKMQLNVFDPDDVRVEFMNFEPSAKPCCSEFTAAHPKP